MKVSTIALCLAAVLLFGCKSPAQQQAEKTAGAIRKTMKAYGPPEVATSENGFLMKATIDGKPWKAESMMAINPSNTGFVHGAGAEVQIGFYIDRDHIAIGKPRELNESHSADLDLGGDNLLSAREGAYIITYSDNNKIEGTFHFKAASPFSDKKPEVSKGFFRIMLH